MVSQYTFVRLVHGVPIYICQVSTECPNNFVYVRTGCPNKHFQSQLQGVPINIFSLTVQGCLRCVLAWMDPGPMLHVDALRRPEGGIWGSMSGFLAAANC